MSVCASPPNILRTLPVNLSFYFSYKVIRLVVSEILTSLAFMSFSPLIDCTSAAENTENVFGPSGFENNSLHLPQESFRLKSNAPKDLFLHALHRHSSLTFSSRNTSFSDSTCATPLEEPTRNNPYISCLDLSQRSADTFEECYSTPHSPALHSPVFAPMASPRSFKKRATHNASPTPRLSLPSRCADRAVPSSGKGSAAAPSPSATLSGSRGIRTVVSATVDRSSGRPIPMSFQSAASAA